MKSINKLLLPLIGLAFLTSIATAQINYQSVTFYTKINKGNVTEIVNQVWFKKMKSDVEADLRQDLEDADGSINSSIEINIPNPQITVTADSIKFSIINFFFDVTINPSPLVSNADINTHFDYILTAHYKLNTNKQFEIDTVICDIRNVNINVQGGNVLGFIPADHWYSDSVKLKLKAKEDYFNNIILPGYSGLILLNCLYSTPFPGVSNSYITIAAGQFIDDGGYIKIPITATFPFPEIIHEIDKTTGEEGLPQVFSLDQNYPNPFNPTTTIKYALKEDVKVSLKVYNTLGQEVRTLVNEDQTAGFKEIMWDGKSNTGSVVPTGLYIYRIQAGNFVKSNKMMLVK
jgi:hypothetical protein